MQSAQGKDLISFIYFGIVNLSNFAVVKSLGKLGVCLMDNNTFLNSRFSN